MVKSEQINELAKALAKAQLEMKAADKSSTNPHFKSKFAALPEVVEVAKVLNKHGLAFAQPTSVDGGATTVETVLMHGESGQWISGSLTMRPQQDTPQGIGSALTYARRYGLCALVGIVADEDDDGNAASAGAPYRSNGNGKKEPPPTRGLTDVDPQEQLSAVLIEACEAGFKTAADKEKWRETNREKINSLPIPFKQAVVAAFAKAEARS